MPRAVPAGLRENRIRLPELVYSHMRLCGELQVGVVGYDLAVNVIRNDFSPVLVKSPAYGKQCLPAGSIHQIPINKQPRSVAVISRVRAPLLSERHPQLARSQIPDFQ